MVNLESLKILTEKLNTDFSKDFTTKANDNIRLKGFQDAINNMDNYVAVVTPDLKLAMINKKFTQMLKDRLGLCPCIGDNVYKTLYNLDELPVWDPFIPAIKHKRVTIREFISPTTKQKYGIIAIPMIYNGVSAVVGIATDEDEL